MKKIIQKYWKSTPKFYRKLGDSLLLIGTTISGFAMFDGSMTLAIIVMVLTVLGKFITNMFSD